MLRSSENWNYLPGGFDALNVSRIYDSFNSYGIPEMLDQRFNIKDLIMYGTEVRRGYASSRGKCVHFFLDDYKFESLWNRPNKTLGPIVNIGQALSPDFSLFKNYPIALQIYNVYRNRWLGRYWQENDIKVIPTIAWGDERSFDFCFLGVPKNSTVAISTVGIRGREAVETFVAGFEEMIRVIEPEKLIVYGEINPVNFESYVNKVSRYESYWSKKRGKENDTKIIKQ